MRAGTPAPCPSPWVVWGGAAAAGGGTAVAVGSEDVGAAALGTGPGCLGSPLGTHPPKGIKGHKKVRTTTEVNQTRDGNWVLLVEWGKVAPVYTLDALGSWTSEHRPLALRAKQ